MAEEGLGYAIELDKIIHTSDNVPLRFRPLSPKGRRYEYHLEKYQISSSASEKFIQKIKELPEMT